MKFNRGFSATRKFFFRVVACVLIQFLAIPYNMLSAAVNIPDTARVFQANCLATFSALDINIPEHMGTKREDFSGEGGNLIIHIQDAHCNYEAQKSIAGMIQHLTDRYGVGFVAVEGADSHVDTTWFRAFPETVIRREVADFFLQKGELTGAEFLSITGDGEFTIYGVEDRALYLDNLRAFLDYYSCKQAFIDYFGGIQRAVNDLKRHIYHGELRDLDKNTAVYESGKMNLSEYVRYLSGLASRYDVDLGCYENFSYLKIDSEGLFDEIALLVSALKDSMFTDQAQRELSRMSDNISIVMDLINMEITTDRYDHYISNEEEFSAEVFLNFIMEQASRLGLNYTISSIPAELEARFSQLVEFYKLVVKRDEVIVENMLEGMAAEKTKVAILVSGGFHTKGITAGIDEMV